MKRARVACVCIISAAIAAPAAADVTFKRKNEGKLVTGLMSGSSVQLLEGSKMRDDQTIGGMATSTIIDVAAQQMISLNLTAMYQKMAALGVPLAQEMNMKFEGSGPMAGMMSKMGGDTMTTEVVSISSEPIPDSTLEVPADYKVIKR